MAGLCGALGPPIDPRMRACPSVTGGVGGRAALASPTPLVVLCSPIRATSGEKHKGKQQFG